MQNPFLIVRFVFFSMLVNANILIVGFASWNIHATMTAGLHVPAIVVFLVFISCLVLFYVTLELAQLLVPHARTSHIMCECIWSAVLSIFQVAAAISLTVNSPALFCSLPSGWSICSSSSLLLPTTWFSSFTILTYFITLFVTTMAHVRIHTNIWSETMHSVDWFGHTTGPITIERHDKISQSSMDSWSRYLEDLESGAILRPRTDVDDCGKAPWARGNNIRRGVDKPFIVRETTLRTSSSPSTTEATLPPKPLNIQPKNSPGSRFIERFREGRLVSRPETPLQYSQHFVSRVTPFPPRVEDHDLPIPLPRLSEWIRADATNGINVHTIPQSP